MNDMMDHTGTPWLDQPVLLHSSRADTCKLTPDQCAYRQGYWRYWYEADHVYALATVYYFIAAIAVFIVGGLLSAYQPRFLMRTKAWQRSVATLRYASYRGFQSSRLSWTSPPLGAILMGISGLVFFFALTLGPKPYYWPNTRELSYGNSPPIATRTGWMALACLPFILISAVKANPITALTGVSYEKMQIFHRWASWACFILALVHTFPFIVHHVWKGDMMMEWRTSAAYWTGVVAILAQAHLTLFSIGLLRNKYYEFFKSTHFVAAVVFVVFFFLHCDFRLTSWDYFIATGVIYILCLLYSQLRTYLQYGIRHKAHLALTETGKIQVTIPAKFSWKPGQHIFIRFLTLGLHSLTSHPFTICSLPPQPNRTDRSKSELVFYIGPRAGFTARLAALANKQSAAPLRVLLEGPYGGVNAAMMARFDKVLLIAGGSGAGFTLPLIEDVLRHLEQREKFGEKAEERGKTEIQVILATRDQSTESWFHQTIEELLSSYSPALVASTLAISIYYTGQSTDTTNASLPSTNDKSLQTSTTSSDSPPSPSPDTHCRPHLPSIVAKATSISNTSVGIAVCGPAEMLQDVRNAAAAAQTRMLTGKEGAREVYLHTEHFSW